MVSQLPSRSAHSGLLVSLGKLVILGVLDDDPAHLLHGKVPGLLLREAWTLVPIMHLQLSDALLYCRVKSPTRHSGVEHGHRQPSAW